MAGFCGGATDRTLLADEKHRVIEVLLFRVFGADEHLGVRVGVAGEDGGLKANIGTRKQGRAFGPCQAAVGGFPPVEFGFAVVILSEQGADGEGRIDDEIAVAALAVIDADGGGFLPGFAVPTVVADLPGETEENMRMALGVDVAGAVVGFFCAGGLDERELVGGFFGHGHF